MRIICNSIGIITSFCDNHKIKDERLRELIVINYEWITKGIYKILSANHLLETNEGRATKEELRGLLSEEKYPNIDDIIAMMKEFYLCRSQLSEDNLGNLNEVFFFPAFFSNRTPTFVKAFKNKQSENSINHSYTYHFISNSIIAFFIIKASERFKHTDFWKDGGLITETDAEALIEADEESNEISIIVKGESSENLLERITEIFKEIHKLSFIPKPKEEIVRNRKKDDNLYQRKSELDKINESEKNLRKLGAENNVSINLFNNQNTQTASQGNNNEVKENIFNQQNNSQILDFQELLNELENLIRVLNEKASTVNDGKSIAKVEQAKEAADEKDASKVVKYLKEGGKFVLDTAKDISAKIITDIIEKQIIGA
jgi:C-terminal of Roc, COR, domain